jgi:hypothetical protein
LQKKYPNTKTFSKYKIYFGKSDSLLFFIFTMASVRVSHTDMQHGLVDMLRLRLYQSEQNVHALRLEVDRLKSCHETARKLASIATKAQSQSKTLETEGQRIRAEKTVLERENGQLRHELETLRLDFGMLLAERELQQNVVQSALELDAVGDEGDDDGVALNETGDDGGDTPVIVHAGAKMKPGIKKRCSVCNAHLYVSRLFRGRNESIRCTGCRV